MTRQSAPIIRSFRILGLHGYKDIEVDFNGPARIVIAENGTGKTTILSALHAFLTCDFDKLKALSFGAIECDFAGDERSLTLQRSQIPQSGDKGTERILSELASYGRVDPAELRRVILDVDLRRLPDIVSVHPLLRDIYHESPLSADDVAEQVRAIRNQLDLTRSGELKELATTIQAAISPCEILYLPTYRRVELPLSKSEGSREGRSMPGTRFRQRPGGPYRSRWTYFGIQFGLADVEDRLTELQNEIQRQSNFGYRTISANIIDELLEARMGTPDAPQLPDIDALSLFFSRIEQASAPEKRLNAIKELYASKEIYSGDNSTLRYFLSKLSKVVDRTRVLEANIEQFVEKANIYLEQSSDEKRLRYDASRMKVVVQNLWTDDQVKLDDLSSGEKQVVSLFASLSGILCVRSG